MTSICDGCKHRLPPLRKQKQGGAVGFCNQKGNHLWEEPESCNQKEKLGVRMFRGVKLVLFISETKTESELNLCDPAILHETLKKHRSMGRNIHLPDHPTLKSPMGYPHMCYGKAQGCSHCVRCIMDYYKEEVEEAKNR